MRKTLISLGIMMLLLGNISAVYAEKPQVQRSHPTKDAHLNMDESEVFDDPQFGRSSTTY